MFLLWIDDYRPAPEGWHWAKSVHEAKIHFVQLGGLNGKPGLVSLDHDAGDYQCMGGDYIEFLKWLDNKAHLDGFDFNHIQFHLHTCNPVGRDNMRGIIKHNGWKEIT